MKIKKIVGFELFDSRGRPTVACKVFSQEGAFLAIVPSGASTGSREALELRDNDKGRFRGLGVLKAVENINAVIAPEIVGKEWESQKEIDEFLNSLDGTENKSRLGANAILAVSMAFAKAFAANKGVDLWQLFGVDGSLPIPLINVINGGVHADNRLDFQEFMIVPHGFNSFREAVRAASEVIMTLKNLIKDRGFSTNVGDEGGFAPNISSTEEALNLIIGAIEASGFVPGKEISLGLDVAASEFYKDGVYKFRKSGTGEYSTQDLISIYGELLVKYPLISIEDPFSEFDEEGWKEFYLRFADKLKIIGDDLICTNIKLISSAHRNKLINGVLIKPNQIGSVSETCEAIEYAKKSDLVVAVSHRSGDTEDSFIADLAVGFGAEFIKTGSICRGERTVKYNRLLILEQEYSLPFKKI